MSSSAVRPLKFVRFDALDGIANVIVDGSAGPSTRLVLSHWPGSATPDDLADDLSAQIALRALDRPELFEGIEAVSNNHFDQDGLMSIYALVDPDGAPARRELVIDVARAGDFGWFESRDAARISMTIAAFGEADRSPLDPATFSDADPTGALYEECLARLPDLLDDVARHRALWETEDAHLDESMRAIAEGTVTIDEHPDADLAIVRVPEAWARRTVHRFTTEWSRAVHPMAINSATRRFRVLVVQGRLAQLECRYETWVRFRSRPFTPRPDLRLLAADLNAREGSARWHADPPGALAPILGSAADDESTLDPDVLVATITDWLRTAAPAWDPDEPAW